MVVGVWLMFLSFASSALSAQTLAGDSVASAVSPADEGRMLPTLADTTEAMRGLHFDLPPLTMAPSTNASTIPLKDPISELKLQRPLSSYSAMPKNITSFELNQRMHFDKYRSHDYMLRWDGGRMTGYNDVELLPGIGPLARAGVTSVHRFDDRWTLTGGAMLQKTSVYYNTALVSGMLTYQLSDQASLNAFGVYQTPSFLSKYHVPGQYQFGGFLTLQTANKKWGIDLGERTEPNPFTGRLDTTPIVMPYYNLQGQKLGSTSAAC